MSTPLSLCSDDSDTDTEDKKFEFYGTYMFVTYAKSTLGKDRILEFARLLKDKLPVDTKFYGCFELHEDGSPHYHVLIQFPKRTHWLDSRKKLMLDGDTEAIKVVTMRRNQRSATFVSNVQLYLEKTLPDGSDKPVTWLFGEKILIGNLALEKKRKFKEILDEPDYDKAKQMIKDEDPLRFIMSYNNVKNFLVNEKTRKYQRVEDESFTKLPWKLPDEITEWKTNNIDNRILGRPNSLLIIGAPKSGKTQWALSFGKPMEMSRKWNMKNYRADSTHLVVNDVPVKGFGYGGDSYWREVLGCQASFDATDKYLENRRLKWNFPCIWTCNTDLDPRKDRDVEEYLRLSGCVVVDLGFSVSSCPSAKSDIQCPLSHSTLLYE